VWRPLLWLRNDGPPAADRVTAAELVAKVAEVVDTDEGRVLRGVWSWARRQAEEPIPD